MTYSTDLKTRVIDFYNTFKGVLFNNSKVTVRSISKLYKITKSTIHRWITIPPQIRIKEENINYHKNINILNFLKRSLDHNPFQNLNMLNIKVFKKFDILLSTTTIGNYIKIIKYSKKKLTRRLYGTKSVKEHIAIRKLKLKEIKKLNKKDIISIDECSINRETHAKYGYCKKTKRLIRYVKRNNLLVNHSLIMAINQNKVMQYELLKNQ